MAREDGHGQSWLIIDTDCGIDDAVALCMALRLAASAGLTCKLLTTVFGNCSIAQVNCNVAKCRQACGYDAQSGPPIVAGAEGPLSGEQAIRASYFHGIDGLGDAGLPDVPDGVSPGVACEQMVQLCRHAVDVGANVTLVALGPLTNVALALRLAPDLPSMVSRFVFMGGCSDARGNRTRVAEFNVMADPDAAGEVFSVDWPQLEVVSWELAKNTSVKWSIFDELFRVQSPASRHTDVVKFLGAVLHGTFVKRRPVSHAHQKVPLAPGQKSAAGAVNGFTKSLPCCAAPFRYLFAPREKDAEGAIICDAVAMAVALRPTAALDFAEVHVEVELEGRITRGQTVVDFGHCFDGAGRRRRVRWILEVDVNEYVQLLRRMLL